MSDTLWRRVTCTKYDVDGFGWCPSNPNGPYELSLWCDICKGWGTFSPYILLEVDDGPTIFFGGA